MSAAPHYEYEPTAWDEVDELNNLNVEPAQPELEYVPICPSCLNDCEGSSFAPYCSSACRLRGHVEAM